MCKLNSYIYDLKQSSGQCYIIIHFAIISCEFRMIDEDPCVYIKWYKDKYVLVSLYMDDTLITRNDLDFVQTIKRWLSSTFETRDKRQTSYILGVKIHRDCFNKLVTLSQEHNIKKIFEWFNIQNCKN